MRIKSWFTSVLCLTLLAGCDSYPKDPDSSLRKAKQSGLRVGAIHSPPWVEVRQGSVTGREAEIVEGFAKSIGSHVEWMTGGESEILPILEQKELQIVIGGLSKETPWRKRVGLTNPYKKESVVVCSTDSTPVPKRIEHLPVAVERGSATIADVKKKSGVPVIVDSLSGYQGLVAVPEDQMKKVQCGSQKLRLVRHQYVLAVPKGENALLAALESYLNDNGY